MSQKIITVFGATGNQGGSTASAILSNPALSSKYKIRAITRDPSKPAARKLASEGAELAKADLNDLASLRKAIAGSYGVFAVTNYWETMSKPTEVQQGKNIVDACKEEGIKHLVWSNLPDASKVSDGELTKIEHFESKAEVGEYAEKVKGDMIVSFFMPGFFMSNLTKQFQPGKDTGVVTLKQPWHATETWVPMLDLQRDTGLFTAGLFEAGPEANGVFVHGVSEWMHPKDITDQVSQITGRKVEFVEEPASVESAAQTGNKIAEELLQNMLLIRDYSYYGKGEEQKQAESDKYLVQGAKKNTWKNFAQGIQWEF